MILLNRICEPCLTSSNNRESCWRTATYATDCTTGLQPGRVCQFRTIILNHPNCGCYRNRLTGSSGKIQSSSLHMLSPWDHPFRCSVSLSTWSPSLPSKVLTRTLYLYAIMVDRSTARFMMIAVMPATTLTLCHSCLRIRSMFMQILPESIMIPLRLGVIALQPWSTPSGHVPQLPEFAILSIVHSIRAGELTALFSRLL